MRLDAWTHVRSLLPSAWASLALLQSCAQVVPADAGDAGAPLAPEVAEVDPLPGAIAGNSTFRVAFSESMDLSLLLLSAGRSDSVVLVNPADVELIASALTHGRLTAAQRSLIVSADATVSSDAKELTLRPDTPLGPGTWYLLVSNRLKDLQGNRMKGNGARYEFTVAAPPPKPKLDAPEPGWLAPSNLRRVTVSFPDGPTAEVALVRRGGGVLAGPSRSDGGPLTLDVARESGQSQCDPLCPGAEYALASGGVEVPGTTFRAASCARSDPPKLLEGSPSIRAADTWLELQFSLDWPAVVRVSAAAPAAGGAPVENSVRVDCAPAFCGGDAGPAAACSGTARLEGLTPSTDYALQISAEDDEGNRSAPLALRLGTTGPLPQVRIDEVMASPPPPAPRSDGEYIELFNTGRQAVDTARLALAGPDDKLRPLVADGDPTPALAPGQRALATGAAFDASRYTLPAGTLILRADTQRLLGHGVPDDPPAIRLMWISDQDGGSPIALDAYPGAGPSCDLGESLERTDQSDGGIPVFRCGADGGSPGRPP